MRQTVTLTRSKTKNQYGKEYYYWVLRWYAPSGRRQSKSLGPVQSMSHREAETLRCKKQSELDANPGRRNVSAAPRLGDFLEKYLEIRRYELQRGTLDLHRMTGRYLEEFFGRSRRLDAVTRLDARAFRASLASGDLARASRRNGDLTVATVNLHVRNARKIFATATEDDLILINPFDHLAEPPVPPKAWHEVTDDELDKLMVAATPAWRLLLAITRHAALRRGEALNLRWSQVDLGRSRLTVIGNGDWRPKDREPRVVPIVPELRKVLTGAGCDTHAPDDLVIPQGSVSVNNVSRRFTWLCQRAGVERYAKPFHTLRKTCLTRWAREFPAHVVATWAGHADIETTREYYLRVSEAEYEKAAGATS